MSAPRNRTLIATADDDDERPYRLLDLRTPGCALVAFDLDSRVDLTNDGPIELIPGTVETTLALREEQGVWKLERPLPDLYVRLDVFLDHLEDTDPDWRQRVWTECVEALRAGAGG